MYTTLDPTHELHVIAFIQAVGWSTEYYDLEKAVLELRQESEDFTTIDPLTYARVLDRAYVSFSQQFPVPPEN